MTNQNTEATNNTLKIAEELAEYFLTDTSIDLYGDSEDWRSEMNKYTYSELHPYGCDGLDQDIETYLEVSGYQLPNKYLTEEENEEEAVKHQRTLLTFEQVSVIWEIIYNYQYHFEE